MGELVLYVAGMSCRRCVREVTARLRDVPGVETLAVDAGRSHLRLTGTMTFRDVIRTLAGTTYRAEMAHDLAGDRTRDSSQNSRQNAPDDSRNGAVSNRDETEPGQANP